MPPILRGDVGVMGKLPILRFKVRNMGNYAHPA